VSDPNEKEQSRPEAAEKPKWMARSSPWTDLAMTVPVFLGYHLGVISLPVRNAADLVTSRLVVMANDNPVLYVVLTVIIGLALTGVLALLGRGQAFELWRLGVVVLEGAAYAVAMGAVASYVVGSLRLAPASGAGTGLVMALGAGLYEEIAFRVVLFGLPVLLMRVLVGSTVRRLVLSVVWAAVAAAVFSGWHYVGAMGDSFQLGSFVFRWVCGLAFTAIYALRGFAPVVWTHALYDIWVLVLV
jgi:hypothetical protein